MHDWRAGLDFPFEQPEPPAPVDRDTLLADNVRLQAEVAGLERELGRTVATLQRLSARLMDLERQAMRTGGAAVTAAALHADLQAARAALAAAEARAADAEAEVEALRATRVMRYSAGARSVYGRLRRT